MTGLVEVFLLSASPLGESKVAIPLAITKLVENQELLNNQTILTIFVIGVIGNILCFPITYLFMNVIHGTFWSSKNYKKLSLWIGKRSKKLTKGLTDKYGFWGLMLFVAVPLPTTGAYMGALMAWMMGYERKKAFVAVSLGAIASATVITIGSAITAYAVQ